jgi:hypothetical protein
MDEQAVTAEDQPSGDGKGGSQRENSSIAFPYLDLEDAIEVAKGIFQNAAGACSIDQLAAYLKHDTTNSGAFRLKLAAARIFGLVETSRDNVRLTTLGLEIVEADRERAARAAAFLKVPLYRAAFDRFRGRQLPPDVALERYFAEIGVAKKQTAKARQAFQRSADQAGFFAQGRDRLVEPVVKETRGEPVPAAIATAAAANGAREGAAVTLHPLIAAMFKTLPSEGEPFPPDRREQWLLTAKNIFDLIYGSY